MAMVKANGYGCGLSSVVPVLGEEADWLGVACLEEAIVVRRLSACDCILMQGVFSAAELHDVALLGFHIVVHHRAQLEWLLTTPLSSSIRVWVKVNTGMQRLGFLPPDVNGVISALQACPWVQDEIGVLTHLACADEPLHPQNQAQLDQFNQLLLPKGNYRRSLSNSALILSRPDCRQDVVRPGVMLYGVSPFSGQDGSAWGLKPVMRFVSALSVVFTCPAGVSVGYGATWQCAKPTRIGVVAVGYGDGYPRHIGSGTPTWVNGTIAPIVGRVSMDMLTVDLTDCPDACEGDVVELWGPHIPVERIAEKAGTIAYELICQVSPRVRDGARVIGA
jgi:alanine racemase